MSYASVAANNAPPPSQQPLPDPSLLNTSPPTAGNVPDDSSKVNLISADYKPRAAVDTLPYTANTNISDDGNDAFPSPKRRKKENRRLAEVEAEGIYLWNVTKHYVLQPGVAGGLIGLVNLGLLAGASRAFYARPHLRRNPTFMSSAVLAAFALISVEGYAAEKYRKTVRGQAEEERAKREGTLLYKYLHEQILRPKILGGFIGMLNAAVIGTVGYLSYDNWNQPSWDRRTVSSVAIGIITMWAGEGLLAYHLEKS